MTTYDEEKNVWCPRCANTPNLESSIAEEFAFNSGKTNMYGTETDWKKQMLLISNATDSKCLAIMGINTMKSIIITNCSCTQRFIANVVCEFEDPKITTPIFRNSNKTHLV